MVSNLFEALVILFATSNGLVAFYTLLSAVLLYLGRKELAKGEEFRKLIDALFLTVVSGFLFAGWNLLLQLRLISLRNETVELFIGNILISILFVSMAYSSFLIKYFAKKYGFTDAAAEIRAKFSKAPKGQTGRPEAGRSGTARQRRR